MNNTITVKESVTKEINFNNIKEEKINFYTEKDFKNLEPLMNAFKDKGNIQDALKGFNEGLEIARKKYNVKEIEPRLNRLGFLIMVESEWQNKKSHAGAEGYYQLTTNAIDEVSRIYGIKKIEIRDDNIDEQAKFAALYLAHLYFDEKVGNGDLQLTLMAYNSGPSRLRRYNRKCEKEKTKPNYEGYVKYLKGIITNPVDYKEAIEFPAKHFALIEVMNKERKSFIRYANGEITYEQLCKVYRDFGVPYLKEDEKITKINKKH